MDKDQLIHDIGARLVADIGDQRPNWKHLVLAVRIDAKHSAMSGFAYYANGEYEPVAPKKFDISDGLVELRDALAAADKKPPWLACLIRIDRETGAIDFDFEYDRADRWDITFRNSKARAEELRPKK
jgi:hypothetical protein